MLLFVSTSAWLLSRPEGKDVEWFITASSIQEAEKLYRLHLGREESLAQDDIDEAVDMASWWIVCRPTKEAGVHSWNRNDKGPLIWVHPEIRDDPLAVVALATKHGGWV